MASWLERLLGTERYLRWIGLPTTTRSQRFALWLFWVPLLLLVAVTECGHGSRHAEAQWNTEEAFLWGALSVSLFGLGLWCGISMGAEEERRERRAALRRLSPQERESFWKSIDSGG